MKLVIAEKPSVAQSIARVIGAAGRKDGYLEGNGYLVSWCVGHLVELSAPETYDERYSKWRLEDLPILPDNWLYQVSSATKKQFGILKELMKRPDVESLVCATDAGREGELIFRLVYNQCHCKKPFERLWISSMEDAAIRDGFRNLKPGTAYDNLYAAALCRERADWIVGMNATRLFSCLYGTTLAVGHVMTPTLGMAVMREAEIQAFKPEIFYEVELQFSGISAKSDRIKERSDAEKAAEICRNEGKAQVFSSVRKEKTEKPPALYDLTSLQRDANRILGFTAQQTLDYTQSLYEKKLVTYPRTDSRYLTDDMAPALPVWLTKTARAFGLTDFFMDPYNEAQKNQISQVINSKKVSDHHAIIPTKTCADTDLSGLPSGEMRIPDGGTVLVTFPDRQFTEKCSYIDDYHLKVGNSVYHICQYAEILKQNGGRCTPEPETELAKAAWQLGHREYLLLERTDAGFRYEILTKDFLSRTQGQLDRPEWTMNQAREYVLDLAGLDHRSRFAVSYDMVKQKSRDVLKSSDVRNIEWVDSKYYPGMRTAEHTLTCEIRGEPFRLTYEVSKHDDGEGFVIHSDGKDIWDLMPEPELEKLEYTLSRAVVFDRWKKDIDQAETVVAVRDVRYGIWETENLNLTREQIQELHEMIDRKEETLTAAMKKDSVLKQLGETKPENGEKKAPKRQKKQKEGERT